MAKGVQTYKETGNFTKAGATAANAGLEKYETMLYDSFEDNKLIIYFKARSMS